LTPAGGGSFRNTEAAFMNEQTHQSHDARSIKTPITETGELELGGHTGLASLMTIGAMYHTARYERQVTNFVIQTDAKGLEMLANDADVALGEIFTSLGAIGDPLCYADTKELNESTFWGLGWMLMSFADMGVQLQNARTRIQGNMGTAQEKREAAA
jgi:hypothetical protein